MSAAVATSLLWGVRGVRCEATTFTSNLDVWAYHNAPGGFRAAAPTFTGDLHVENGQFVPKGNSSVARLGMALMAFKTTPEIPATARIQSVTVTATMERGGSGALIYRTSPLTSEELLEEVSGEATTARPMELYGVGFRGNYGGFGLGALPPGKTAFQESTFVYGPDGYVVYPIASSETDCCGYVDVTNSPTGGFSATHGATSPFDPTPWAIGTTDLTPGDEIPGDRAVFTFSLDLSDTAVREYVRAGVKRGELGFFLSSLHLTEELGAGGAYPSWFMKEASVDIPTLSIVYEDVEPQAGDFDVDGDVDGDDFLFWQCTVGQPVENGLGADGSGNGVVNVDDLAIWRQHFGNASPDSGMAAIPEPAGTSLVFGAAAAGCWRAISRRVRSERQERT